MRRRTALIPTGLLIAAIVLATNGCDRNGVELGCQAPVCHLDVHDGSSVTIAGQKLSVEAIDGNSVKLDSHGVTITLSKDVSVGIGRYHLHLEKVESGSADITVDDKP
ncbi:hypothetical protein OG455_09795 [Kitasatospora sp. NBC_01287]|uniref:hypothetical protein n=1 Tax=Kitasatospora sp. NBC_01287 TaxID=2903573 RepID=UPI002252C340|nr:hypothetical protein [Kitasatospora sp. NBC_01287]MCX4745812.1 hypothetical protein [Kitasatospora sp. NBC_01287]